MRQTAHRERVILGLQASILKTKINFKITIIITVIGNSIAKYYGFKKYIHIIDQQTLILELYCIPHRINKSVYKTITITRDLKALWLVSGFWQNDRSVTGQSTACLKNAGNFALRGLSLVSIFFLLYIFGFVDFIPTHVGMDFLLTDKTDLHVTSHIPRQILIVSAGFEIFKLC